LKSVQFSKLVPHYSHSCCLHIVERIGLFSSLRVDKDVSRSLLRTVGDRPVMVSDGQSSVVRRNRCRSDEGA